MPFCKICYDAGNADYSNHNIKVYNIEKRCIEITCPYLKNITCTRCGKKEHTASYCKEKIYNIQQNSRGKLPTINKLSKPIVIKDTSTNKVNLMFSNLFSVLCDDDESKTVQIYNEDKISYTLDGECLGKLSDIIWGRGFLSTANSWSDEIV
tara:strand:- start:19 stop:474 length:456 start_codon:yes stop_codon:yes gene_type:complete